METIGQLIERGFISGIVLAAVFSGFALFLYLLFRLLKRMRPQEIRQKEQRLLSHRLYNVSGRGRIAYLILCLESALQCYGQELTAWEKILRKLWSITDCTAEDWMGVWLDAVGDLLPCMVLTPNSSAAFSEEMQNTRTLYTQAGTAMIVIDTILDTAYSIVGEWSPNTGAHDPDALCAIEKAEETMREFGVPFPEGSTVQRLLTEQKNSSFGAPFDGLRLSALSQKDRACDTETVFKN